MTNYQRLMLTWLRDRGAGCARVAGRWVWPEDVRESPALAEALWRVVS